MKKSLLIVISLVAVFFFASTNQVIAQWSVDVHWIDDDCSCANITSKVLDWEIRKVSDNSLLASGSMDVTTVTPPQTLSDTDNVEADELYKVCAKVQYFEASIDPLCCQDSRCITIDSEKLINGGETVYLFLN